LFPWPREAAFDAFLEKSAHFFFLQGIHLALQDVLSAEELNDLWRIKTNEELDELIQLNI
jgi:hypothetical protein